MRLDQVKLYAKTYSDILSSPVTLLPPVNRSRPVDLKNSRQRSDDPVAEAYLSSSLDY